MVDSQAHPTCIIQHTKRSRLTHAMTFKLITLIEWRQWYALRMLRFSCLHSIVTAPQCLGNVADNRRQNFGNTDDMRCCLKSWGGAIVWRTKGHRTVISSVIGWNRVGLSGSYCTLAPNGKTGVGQNPPRTKSPPRKWPGGQNPPFWTQTWRKKSNIQLVIFIQISKR